MQIQRYLPPKKGWVKRVQIISDNGHTYIIGVKADATLGCSCKGYINHRKCKHIPQYQAIVRQSILITARRGRNNGERS